MTKFFNHSLAYCFEKYNKPHKFDNLGFHRIKGKNWNYVEKNVNAQPFTAKHITTLWEISSVNLYLKNVKSHFWTKFLQIDCMIIWQKAELTINSLILKPLTQSP